jgi:hypothetical protein
MKTNLFILSTLLCAGIWSSRNIMKKILLLIITVVVHGNVFAQYMLPFGPMVRPTY